MGIETSLTEQEMNFIASGGTTPLDTPDDMPPPATEVRHEEDTTPEPDVGSVPVDGDPENPPAEGDGNAAAANAEADGEAAGADRDRRVPYAALKEEREARKERDRQLAELTDKFARADERLQIMQQHLQQQNAPKPAAEAQPDPVIPRPEDDFVGALKWTQDQIIQRETREREQAQRQEQETTQQRRNRDAENYVVSTYQQAAAAAKAEDPNFDNAYEFIITQRYNEHLASGLSPEQAQAQVQRDEFGMAVAAIQARQNPAQRLVALARARGWSPPAPQSAAPGAQDRLDTVARGIAANKTLSGAGAGGAGKGKLDLDALVAMPDKEFAAFLEKNPDAIGKVMGAKA